MVETVTAERQSVDALLSSENMEIALTLQPMLFEVKMPIEDFKKQLKTLVDLDPGGAVVFYLTPEDLPFVFRFEGEDWILRQRLHMGKWYFPPVLHFKLIMKDLTPDSGMLSTQIYLNPFWPKVLTHVLTYVTLGILFYTSPGEWARHLNQYNPTLIPVLLLGPLILLGAILVSGFFSQRRSMSKFLESLAQLKALKDKLFWVNQ